MSKIFSSNHNLSRKEVFDISHGKPAVIVGVDTPNNTHYSGKFNSTPPNVVAQRYRIRILSEDPADKPEENLPVAYPLQLTSGLGAQDSGFIRYPPNTKVRVTQDPVSKHYYIIGVVPNAVGKLSQDPELSGTGTVPCSGFPAGAQNVPTTNTLNGQLNTGEQCGTQPVSDEDPKTDHKPKLPKIKSACDTANLAGVNEAILNMIKDIEELRTELLGEDSFLGQANEFLGEAQAKADSVGRFSFASVDVGGESYDITIGNAAGDISTIIAAIIQEVRKWVLRKITTGANQVTGRVPLAGRYVANEAMDKGLTTTTCFIANILKNLEEMIANILKGIVDKILNATECLVENVIGGIVGTVLGNMTAVINGILSKISGIISQVGGVVGEIAELTGEMLDFVISILDLFLCKKKNICPDTSTWDFLAGSKPASLPTLDGVKIFNKAKSVTESIVSTVGNITADIKEEYNELTGEGFRELILTKDDGTEFNVFEEIDSGTVWQNIIDGGCDTGAVNCGPPEVVFFGGDGDGATGNPVINLAGELIGVDIVTPGKYKKAPLVSFEDACGKGKGAIGRPVIGKVKNKNKIVYRWKEKRVKIKEGEVARLTIVRSGRTDVRSRIRVKTLRNRGTASFNDDFKFKKEIIEFKPGQTEKVFKIKARAKGEGGEGFRNTDIEGEEHFYVSIKVKELKEKDNEGIKKLDKIKLKIREKRKYVKVVITEDEPETIGYEEEPTPLDENNILKPDENKEPDEPADDELPDDFENPDDDDDDEVLGLTDVIMDDTGYGYEGYPYGDKGGGGRVWANRCQTTVHRANYNWDIPYSEGRTITAYYGDEITFPGEQTILIDENFTEDKIPGCVIKGTNPKIKDMSNFDYTRGKTYETGIKHQFGLAGDAKWAMEQGFTEQDIRFFLTNKFFLRVGPKMREKLEDPEWGKIPEYSVTFTAPGCPAGTPEDPNEPPNPPDGEGDDKVAILGDIVIDNRGFGYSEDDEVIIPGGEGELIVRNGKIIGVNITNPGIGYTTLPEIRINTKTGFNANLKPVLRFIDVNDSGFVVPPGTPTLQVIDCVGKV